MNDTLIKSRRTVVFQLRVKSALEWLGMPTARRFAECAPEIKRRLIEARKNGDDESATQLSQLKEFLKKKLVPGCAVCGAGIARRARRCTLHSHNLLIIKPVAILLLTAILAGCATNKVASLKAPTAAVRMSAPFPAMPVRFVFQPNTNLVQVLASSVLRGGTNYQTFVLLTTNAAAQIVNIVITNPPVMMPPKSHVVLSWDNSMTVLRGITAWNLSPTQMSTRMTLTVPIVAQEFFRVPTGVQTVLLSWDASPTVTVMGYNVYVGSASRTYGTAINAGNNLTWDVPIPYSSTEYFAVTAYDAFGSESDFSNEVMYAADGDGVVTIKQQ